MVLITIYQWPVNCDSQKYGSLRVLQVWEQQVLSNHLLAFWTQRDADYFTKVTPAQLYAWGQGAFGKLGLGSDASQFDPKLVTALDGVLINDLSSGKTVTACIDESGNILTWGKPINVMKCDKGIARLWYRQLFFQSVQPSSY